MSYTVTFEADYNLEAELGESPDDNQVVQAMQDALGFTGVIVTAVYHCERDDD